MNKKKEECKCPFCEPELKTGCFEPAFCSPCDVKFVECKNCGKSFDSKMGRCPVCGVKK